MTQSSFPTPARFRARACAFLFAAFATGALAACASVSTPGAPVVAAGPQPAAAPASPAAPALSLASAARNAALLYEQAGSGDPREGLAPGLFDAGEAIWNMRLVSATPPEEPFVGSTNSDLAFTGDYAIQGNYDGVQVWDISDPANPTSVVTYVCPASQSDVSVYENLLFVSGEGLGGRLDCGEEGVRDAVSHDRLRGIRIFDISNIAEPEYVANVQTCRGSHTHTVLKHPGDDDNVYIYVSGSAPVRPAEELAGCSGAMPSDDPNSALFRIEVIRVPLANPAEAAIVSSPRIFEDLVEPPRHGPSAADLAEIEEARRRGAFILEHQGESIQVPERYVAPMLDSIVRERGGEGDPTAADSAALRTFLENMIALQTGGQDEGDGGPAPGPTQCHDITVYPAIGLAGGACEGYGMLIDIADPAHPKRLAAVSDSNFAYWHSATFNNDGTAILFTDEWGGGGGPKCRAGDPMEWGANAIFTIEDGEMNFQSYYKLPAVQTSQENCVAHNGSSDTGARPRHHDSVLVPGRIVLVRLDRSRESRGDRLLRPRPRERRADGVGRQLVRVLVQRRHRQLRDCAGLGRLGAEAQRLPDPERDRRRQFGAARPAELAGTTDLRVACHVRAPLVRTWTSWFGRRAWPVRGSRKCAKRWTRRKDSRVRTEPPPCRRWRTAWLRIASGPAILTSWTG